MEIKTLDVGSLPFEGKRDRFLQEALSYMAEDKEHEYFVKKTVDSFIDKIETGLNIPNYPQFRNMNEMFLEMMDGVEKIKEGYVSIGKISLKPGVSEIPEVKAIKEFSSDIYEKTGFFNVKVCVTGPYTLSQLFSYRNPSLIQELGKTLAEISEKNIFKKKYGQVTFFTLDEPTFGLIDDPLIDFGAKGREKLKKAWEKIFKNCKDKGVETGIHLHSTSDKLFWEINSLNIVESHVEDPLYKSLYTKEQLEKRKKKLKGSICITDFDKLIMNKLKKEKPNLKKTEIMQEVGNIWNKIRKGETKPETFLEKEESIKERIKNLTKYFGAEKIPYVGPECGLRSLPTYKCAIQYLRKMNKAVNETK